MHNVTMMELNGGQYLPPHNFFVKLRLTNNHHKNSIEKTKIDISLHLEEPVSKSEPN